MRDLPCGCPGSQVRTVPAPAADAEEPSGRVRSELRQWPTQLHLVPPSAPWLRGANLLVAADCAAFAYGEFHRDFIKGRAIVNACPKLDETSGYVAKLTAILQQNDIQSVTVPIMEVPCCRGLAMMVQQAVAASGKDIPLELVVIGVDGSRRV
jgi:hypothetical protein